MNKTNRKKNEEKLNTISKKNIKIDEYFNLDNLAKKINKTKKF